MLNVIKCKALNDTPKFWQTGNEFSGPGKTKLEDQNQ